MILVFDLDDTLYEELSYVRSGFKVVAEYLYNAYSIPLNNSYELMMKLLYKEGRGRVFDNTLGYYGIYNKETVKKCVSVYRGHRPNIHLFSEADSCLNNFAHLSIYIVTDGNKLVQQKKIEALGLDNRVKHCYITHRYGIINAKPSPYCFIQICKRKNIKPDKVFYIGDNPYKDFVGIKPLGFRTVRVLTGNYKDIRLSEEYEADFSINSLSFLTLELLKKCYCTD